MTSGCDLLAIERAGVKAWPALETVPIGGWLWRFSQGGSQRANSVSALADPGMDVERAIDEAEKRYAAKGAVAKFQITDVAVPGDLDERLARRGYLINDPCTTLASPLTGNEMPDGIEIADRVTPDWLDTYASVITPDRRKTAPMILEGIPAGSAFVLLRRNGRPVATTLAVVDGEASVVECVATREEARRTGAGDAVMRAAMAWACQRGARVMGLGAVAANAPAQALYRRLGFTLAGRYHTRFKPT